MSENAVVNESTENTEPEAPKSENDLRREAYSEATTALRKNFRKEFDTLLDAAYAERGITRRTKMTEEEKAISKMKKFAEAAGIKLTDEQIAALRAGE